MCHIFCSHCPILTNEVSLNSEKNTPSDAIIISWLCSQVAWLSAVLWETHLSTFQVTTFQVSKLLGLLWHGWHYPPIVIGSNLYVYCDSKLQFELQYTAVYFHGDWIWFYKTKVTTASSSSSVLRCHWLPSGNQDTLLISSLSVDNVSIYPPRRQDSPR